MSTRKPPGRPNVYWNWKAKSLLELEGHPKHGGDCDASRRLDRPEDRLCSPATTEFFDCGLNLRSPGLLRSHWKCMELLLGLRIWPSR
ncbi:hypothetical protein RHSIM_RhsimUnG0213300 [Rhododendron simsii]|uniref:Uncharacterized protein n=1 Tax=Rhododendron simsii TaxID=118357 RepID=A0A834FYS1_RHOSS|nr:hypothetical protein RHSIM_RhsimUnG0213300 [Rhododendron simsii]